MLLFRVERRVTPAAMFISSLRRFEGPVLLCIFVFALICTVLPAILGYIDSVDHFYACWLKNDTGQVTAALPLRATAIRACSSSSPS